MYIKSLKLTSDNDKTIFIRDLVGTCYNGVYPFKIFPEKGLERIGFAPITIFYGLYITTLKFEANIKEYNQRW